MIIPSKHSGYQAGIRLYPGGGKGGGGSDPAVGRALERQADNADRMSAFVMQNYEDNKPMLAKLQGLNADVIQQQLGLGAKAGERADDAYSFYKNVGRPVVQQSIQEATNWDSEDNINAARGRAAADAQSAASNAEGQLNRNLQRTGVNPNSGRMLAMNNQVAMQKAAMLAGGMNNAGEQRRTQAVGMRQQAANMANGFSAQSMAQAGQAGGFGSSAAGIGGNSLSQGMSTQNQALSGMNAVGNQYGNNAQGYQSMSNANNQSAQASAAGFGQLAGMGMSAMGFANGGKIRGPGTGTSDEVPAVNGDSGQPIRLSNGEYIVSADVVRAKGQEFFDRLQQKYHQPVKQSNLRSPA